MKKNKIAIFDIDGTIFRKNLHFEIIDELAWLKIFPQKARKRLVSLYTNWISHKGTYEQYRQALVDLYIYYIKGCKKSDILKASEAVVSYYAERTYLFAEKIIEKLKKENYHIIAISGSPSEVVNEYNKNYLKFDDVFGSEYEVDENGFYTGKVIFEPTKNKGDLVKQYLYEKRIDFKNSYGIGDTESDVSFLSLVENPIAFNPNEKLKDVAEKEKWSIVVERKSVIYFINKNNIKL